MKLSAHIPPDSQAATGAHRALMALRARRLVGSDHPGAGAVARALRTTARGQAPAAEREWIARIQARRAEIPFEMAAAEIGFAIVPGNGGGEPRRAPGNESNAPGPAHGEAERLAQAWEICRWTCIPPIWGRFLARLVRELAPASCLELGTGLGLSAAYQASSLELNGAGSLVTVDVHEAARIAERGFARLGLEHRVKLRFGLIEDALPELVERIAPIEYAFLDAEHSEEATIRHFDALLPYLADGAIVVLDDITQTAEMRQAWSAVCAREQVSLALGLRRVGVVGVSGPAENAA